MATVQKTIVCTDAAPAAVGPYSQAVIVDNTVYVSGMIGFIPGSDPLKIVEGGAAPETDQALKNMEAVLKAAGCNLSNVVKTTVLLADIKEYATVNEVYAKYFTASKPARAAYQVAALPKGAQVEIEAIAVRGNIVESKS